MPYYAGHVEPVRLMDPKTWTLLTDDESHLKMAARSGMIVRGPKLKFSFRFWRWLYWVEVKHTNYAALTEE